MGHDSNVKSYSARRRQHLMIMILLIASVYFIVALLRQDNQHPLKRARGEDPLNDDVDKPRLSADLVSPREQDTQRNGPTQKQLEHTAAQRVAELTAKVRKIKKTGVIMETDKHSLEMTGLLQQATRELIKLRYGDFGDKNYRIRMDLEFQPSIPDFEQQGKDATLLLELAPIALIPCSVFNFLDIARTWREGAFHRNAGHVLQARARSDVTQSMPFQEYSAEYPHKLGTVGYAGRPSGPAFYISILDNTHNHGPGSQQKHNPFEADCIVGTIIEGMQDVVPRIHRMPGHEFIADKNKWVLIRRMHILVPGDAPDAVDGYVEFSKSPVMTD